MNDMTNENSVDTLIDRYRVGEMTSEERTAFRELVAQHPEQAKLLAADRLIQNVAGVERARAEVLPVDPPSAPILSLLKRTNPARRVRMYGLVAGGSFAALLCTLLISTSQRATHAPSPTHQTLQIIADTTSAPGTPVQWDASARETPAHLGGQASAASSLAGHSKSNSLAVPSAVADGHPPAPTANDRDLDEGLGKPRVFSNDSIPVLIHTK